MWQSVIVLFFVVTISFIITRISGDPVLLLVSPDASDAEIAAARQRLGFDQPLVVQYVKYLGQAIQGDFGESLRYSQPALPLVIERLPATLELALFALGVSVTISLTLGVMAAVRRGSIIDHLSMVIALAGQALPVFLLGILAILVFSVRLRWLPTSGRGGIEHLVLPGLTLGLYSTARLTRLVRAGMIETLGQDYIRTARGKGLSERIVVVRHAMRNTLLSVITVVGIELGSLLGGAVVVETVFAWPGMGLLAVQAINSRDFPIVLAEVAVIGSLIILINLVVDLLYGVFDPRIRGT